MINITTATPNESEVQDEGADMLIEFNVKSLSRAEFLGCALYLTILGILAVFGNTLVIAIFIKEKKLRKKPLNLLLLNLAISDLGISLFCYPLTTASNYAGRFLLGRVGCTAQGFLTFTLAQTNMNTMATISIYRYISVCKPHLLFRITALSTKWVIAMNWFYSLVWTVPPLIGWSSYILEPFGTSCSIDWTNAAWASQLYTWCLVVFCFLFHVAIMVSCYYPVAKKSQEVNKRLSQSVSSWTTPADSGVSCFHATITKENQTTLLAVAMTCLFVLVWSPYTLVCVWSLYNPELHIWVTTLPTMFAKSSCTINPFLYFLTNTSFRQSAVKKTVKGECFWRDCS